jgi:hypothetical protein
MSDVCTTSVSSHILKELNRKVWAGKGTWEIMVGFEDRFVEWSVWRGAAFACTKSNARYSCNTASAD